MPWFSGQLLLIWGSILEPWGTILGVFGLIVGVQGPPWTPFGELWVPFGHQGPFCELFSPRCARVAVDPGSIVQPYYMDSCFFWRRVFVWVRARGARLHRGASGRGFGAGLTLPVFEQTQF